MDDAWCLVNLSALASDFHLLLFLLPVLGVAFFVKVLKNVFYGLPLAFREGISSQLVDI
jgi:hypothetical protein